MFSPIYRELGLHCTIARPCLVGSQISFLGTVWPRRTPAHLSRKRMGFRIGAYSLAPVDTTVLLKGTRCTTWAQTRERPLRWKMRPCNGSTRRSSVICWRVTGLQTATSAGLDWG